MNEVNVFDVTKEILADPDLSSTDKLVLGRIRAFFPQVCPMKYNDYYDELGISFLSVKKSLKKLKELNYIKDGSYGCVIAVKE